MSVLDVPEIIQDVTKIQNPMFPNVASSDKWILTFSNIPTLSDNSYMRYFDNYVSSFVLPDYNIDMINIDGPFGFMTRHPAAPKKNTNLSQLQITYKLSEDMFNYWILFRWMYNLKYGNVNIEQKDSELFRWYSMEKATVTMLDNQKRPVVNIHFTKLLPASLSSLQLVMGTSEELEFTVNFTYEEIDYDLKDTFAGGVNPSAPITGTPVCGSTGVPIPTTMGWSA